MSLDDAIKKAIGVKFEKALVSGDEGDFIPKEYADEFINIVREKNWCRQLFTSIKMTASVMYIPKVTGDANVYYISTESTAPAVESKPTFAAAGSVALEAKKLMSYATISNEADEDAKIAMMPLIKESFAAAIAKGEEECMINGNVFAYAGAQDRRKAFNGLVKLAADASQDVVYATSLIATIEAARRKLGVHGRDVKDLVLMVNSYTASALRQLDQVLTIDKYGASATILSGEVGKVMGITIVENAYIIQDATNETVMYAPANADKGTALLVNKKYPIIGDKRQVKFDQDKVISTDSIEIAISERIGFTVQHVEGLCLITGLANGV
jgi:HK97 family phage major capsid protein